MPAAKPLEFRRRAVDLARRREQPVAQIAKDLGISESCLRRWMGQADIDQGAKEGLSSDERRELVELRRRTDGLHLQEESLGPGDALKRAAKLHSTLTHRRSQCLARLDALLEILGRPGTPRSAQSWAAGRR